MKWIVYCALCTILANRVANAEPRVYHLSLSGGELIHNREPMLPEVPMNKWGTAVRWEIGLEWNYVFWDNRIAYESCYSKICTASWTYQLGYIVNKNIDIYWEHKSQHTFDRLNNYGKVDRYPLQDALMIRVNFIDEKRWRD